MALVYQNKEMVCTTQWLGLRIKLPSPGLKFGRELGGQVQEG